MESKDIKAKELSKSPFKKGNNDLHKHVEYFHKEISKILAKNPLDPQEALWDFFSKELAKSKDPIETWIKGNALDMVGYGDFGGKFLQKAAELGYQVDPVMEGIDENEKFELEVKQNGRVIDHITIPGYVLKDLKSMYGTPRLGNSSPSTLEGKKIKAIFINENVEGINVGDEGTVVSHDTEADIIKVKWDDGKESIVLPEDKFDVIDMYVENLVLNPENGKADISLGDAAKNSNTDLTSHSKQPLEDEPEFSKQALANLINNDAFLKFTYSELATDDQDKDLEKMYKHYIKGDESMEQMLKMHESYLSKIQESTAPKLNLKYFTVSTHKEVTMTDDTRTEAVLKAVVLATTKEEAFEKAKANGKISHIWPMNKTSIWEMSQRDYNLAMQRAEKEFEIYKNVIQ
jgi:hypothetical protein